MAAARLNYVPTSNFTYADADGNILDESYQKKVSDLLEELVSYIRLFKSEK